MARWSEITEAMFVERVKAWIPPVDSTSEYLKPPFVKKDANEAQQKAFREGKSKYLDLLTQELLKIAEDDESSLCYLALQPIWKAGKDKYTLAGGEVLVRVKNGTDGAPMPGLAWFQEERKMEARMFLETQIQWATQQAIALPKIYVSVNVRPDELVGAKKVILKATEEIAEKHGGQSNLLIEVTEYSPITDEVLKTIEEMIQEGVKFSMDDVSYEAPNHACTFQLARESGHLFVQQKLALPVSFKAFDVDVYPTPLFAGGSPLAFFKSQRLKTEDIEAVQKLKSDVEKWVEDALKQNPSVDLVIEASVHPDDLIKGRSPDIGLLEKGFQVQGGYTGGRAFPPSFFAEPQ